MHFDSHMNKKDLIAKLRAFAKKNQRSLDYGFKCFRVDILADFLEKSELSDVSHHNVLRDLAAVIAKRVTQPALRIETHHDASRNRPNLKLSSATKCIARDMPSHSKTLS